MDQAFSSDSSAHSSESDTSDESIFRFETLRKRTMDTIRNVGSLMSGVRERNAPCPLCGSKSGDVSMSNLEQWARGAANFDSDPRFKSFQMLKLFIDLKADGDQWSNSGSRSSSESEMK